MPPPDNTDFFMPLPDNIDSPFVKTAKIAASEPTIWPVPGKIPAFCLVPGLIHPQGTPANCYWGLRTSLLPCLDCLPRPIPNLRPPCRVPTKLEGSGAWRHKDPPPLLQSLPATSCGPMPSAECHPGPLTLSFSHATARYQYYRLARICENGQVRRLLASYMACGNENTGNLPRARPGTSTGDTYQLLLGALHLLTLLVLPAQADTLT